MNGSAEWRLSRSNSAREFLEQYFLLKQKHEREWEETWQEKLRPFFGAYFLKLRAEQDRNWAVLPRILRMINEDDDTQSFITGAEGHHTKRYYITQSQGNFAIDRIMIQCSLCEGTGRVMQSESEGNPSEVCPLCDGRGWDDWLD